MRRRGRGGLTGHGFRSFRLLYPKRGDHPNDEKRIPDRSLPESLSLALDFANQSRGMALFAVTVAVLLGPDGRPGRGHHRS